MRAQRSDTAEQIEPYRSINQHQRHRDSYCNQRTVYSILPCGTVDHFGVDFQSRTVISAGSHQRVMNLCNGIVINYAHFFRTFIIIFAVDVVGVSDYDRVVSGCLPRGNGDPVSGQHIVNSVTVGVVIIQIQAADRHNRAAFEVDTDVGKISEHSGGGINGAQSDSDKQY